MDKIIKQILIKVGGDTKDFEKSAQKITATLKDINKTTTGGGGTSSSGGMYGRLAKDLQGISQVMQKAGVPLEKSFKNMQESIKKMVSQDFKQLSKELSTLQSQTAKAYERINQAKAQGNTELANIRQRVFDTMQGRLTDTAQMAQQSAEGRISGRDRAMGALKGVTAIGAIGAAAGTGYLNYSQNLIANQTAMAAPLVGRRISAYSGDLTESLMQARHRATSIAAAEADNQAKAYKTIALSKIAGGLGGATLGAGAALTGAGVLPGLAAMGTGLYTAGTSAIDLVSGGPKAFRARAFEQILQQQKAQSITPYLYNRMKEQAPFDALIQNQLGIGDRGVLGVKLDAARSGLDYRQVGQTALGLRGIVGSQAGLEAAGAAGDMYRGLGQSYETTAGLMGSLTRSTTGGAQSAKKELEDMFTRALSKGIVDSGQVEMIQKMTASIQDGLTFKTSGSDIMGNLLTGINKSKPMDMMNIQNAVAGRNILSQEFSEGGTNAAARNQILLKELKKAGVSGVGLESLMALPDRELLQGMENSTIKGAFQGAKSGYQFNGQKVFKDVLAQQSLINARNDEHRTLIKKAQDIGWDNLSATEQDRLTMFERSNRPGSTDQIQSSLANQFGTVTNMSEETSEAGRTELYRREEAFKSTRSSKFSRDVMRGATKEALDMSFIPEGQLDKARALADQTYEETKTAGNDINLTPEALNESLGNFVEAINKATSLINQNLSTYGHR